MARIIEDKFAGPDDEIYQEGPTIWSPNYVRPGMPSGSIPITPDGKVPEQQERKDLASRVPESTSPDGS
jgi:hypothetical protein